MLLLLTPLAWGSSKNDDFAIAIAKAEGFYIKNSLPNRYHNPGDIKYDRTFRYHGQVGVGKGGHVIFRNDAAGWYALRAQIDKMKSGESRHYSPTMTINQIAKKYAANYRVWAKNVAHNLDTTPTTTIAELFDIPPVLNPAWVK
jgi:hypothetical protein